MPRLLPKGVLMVSWPLLLLAIASGAEKTHPPGHGTLRRYADQLGFRIGAAFPPRLWGRDTEGEEVLAEEFNSTVVQATMGATQPQPGRFNFSAMDAGIEFARAHDMKLYGAALIYRADSLPPWMDNMRASGRELDEIMRNHIQTVIRHGGDAFYAVGVVNEPLTNPNEPWQRAFGRDEYIAKAFRYARQANPDVRLVLNQAFGLDGVDRGMTDEFFDLVARLKSQGVPIDAAGIEMHLEAQQLRPGYLDEFRYFLSRAKQAGVEVYITEMDVYQGPPGSTPDLWGRQKQIYHDVAAACLDDKVCKGLTVWGVSDKDTWLSRRKCNPREDAKPLLFDDDYGRKLAYDGVLEALKARAERN